MPRVPHSHAGYARIPRHALLPMKILFPASSLLAAFVLSLPAAGGAETMKAAVIVDGQTVVQNVPRPATAAGQVLVKVRAAAVNPVDWRSASGAPRGGPGPGAASSEGRGGPPATTGPRIPGFDAAGVIAALGEGVTGWKVGDEVIAFAEPIGAYAEYVAIAAGNLCAKPKALSFEEAAGIPTVAYAAWAVLVDVAKVGPGQRVLIHGAAGGTGTAAVQLAKARGAYVIGTASQRNHEFLKSIGVDEAIDYTAVKFEEKVKDVDIVFNNIDTDTANRSISVVKRGGIIVAITGSIDMDKVTAAGIRYSGRQRGGTPIGEVMRQVAALAEAGKYDVNVDKTFPLAGVNEAWEASKAGRTRGKIIIQLD
jgi:NADPH:quinone reductase-like Zn-dependent oxidoreductase